MKNLKSINSLIVLCALIFALSGCEKDEESPSVLPPISSFEMDFSFTKKKSALMLNDTSNFIIARNAVTFWSLAAYVHTALPVIAFKTAISNKPVYDKVNNMYTWTFTFKFGNDNYNANLTGEVNTEEDSVMWEMNITKVGSTGGGFKWFEGKSAMDRTGGWWLLYNNSLGGDKKSIRIDWDKESESVGTLRYTNVTVGSDNNGAYIEFGATANTTFDRYFEIYIKKDTYTPANNGKTYTIQWNSINKNGKISDGSNNYCWDTNYINTTCN